MKRIFLVVNLFAMPLIADVAHDLDSIAQTSFAAPLHIMAEISIGELIDKITILQIKSERIDNEKKLCNITQELDALLQTKATLPTNTQLDSLMEQLKKINESLWDIEDAIRLKEKDKEFDNTFIELARSVYLVNDDRARVKKEINFLTGSRLIEEKSYQEYRS